MKAFKLFDLDDSGSISADELKKTLGNLVGKKMSD
jgi:Ca2+-binding EF-hand superfamily protein